MPCRICHTPLRAKARAYCSAACKTISHNIRKVRGDQIYDLLMTRAESYKNRNLITEIDQMVRGWLEEDKVAGRKTHTRLVCGQKEGPSKGS